MTNDSPKAGQNGTFRICVGLMELPYDRNKLQLKSLTITYGLQKGIVRVLKLFPEALCTLSCSSFKAVNIILCEYKAKVLILLETLTSLRNM